MRFAQEVKPASRLDDSIGFSLLTMVLSFYNSHE